MGSREAIARLIFACDDHNDRGDFDGVGALFAHGTVRVKDMDGSWTGSDAVATQFAYATQVYPVGDDTSGLARADEVAGVDRGDPVPGESLREPSGRLLHPSVLGEPSRELLGSLSGHQANEAELSRFVRNGILPLLDGSAAAILAPKSDGGGT